MWPPHPPGSSGSRLKPLPTPHDPHFFPAGGGPLEPTAIANLCSLRITPQGVCIDDAEKVHLWLRAPIRVQQKKLGLAVKVEREEEGEEFLKVEVKEEMKDRVELLLVERFC